jgi:hypothetical protein
MEEKKKKKKKRNQSFLVAIFLYPSVVKMATRKLVRYYVANSYDCS